jgi:hypothetical protein
METKKTSKELEKLKNLNAFCLSMMFLMALAMPVYAAGNDNEIGRAHV